MKRLIAVMMVLAVLTAGYAYAADEDSSMQDAFMDQLNMLSLVYRISPDDFTPHMMLSAYHLYNLACHAQAYEAALAWMKAEQYGALPDGVVESAKAMEVAYYEMTSHFDEGFLAWLNGEKSDEEFAKELMEFIDRYVNELKE